MAGRGGRGGGSGSGGDGGGIGGGSFRAIQDSAMEIYRNLMPALRRGSSFRQNGTGWTAGAAERKASRQQAENLVWQQDMFLRLINMKGLFHEGLIGESDVASFRQKILDRLDVCLDGGEYPQVTRDKLLFLQELLYARCISEEQYHSVKKSLIYRLAAQGAEINASDIVLTCSAATASAPTSPVGSRTKNAAAEDDTREKLKEEALQRVTKSKSPVKHLFEAMTRRKHTEKVRRVPHALDFVRPRDCPIRDPPEFDTSDQCGSPLFHSPSGSVSTMESSSRAVESKKTGFVSTLESKPTAASPEPSSKKIGFESSPKIGFEKSPKLAAAASPEPSSKIGFESSPKIGFERSPKLAAAASPEPSLKKIGFESSPKIGFERSSKLAAAASPEPSSKIVSSSKLAASPEPCSKKIEDSPVAPRSVEVCSSKTAPATPTESSTKSAAAVEARSGKTGFIFSPRPWSKRSGFASPVRSPKASSAAKKIGFENSPGAAESCSKKTNQGKGASNEFYIDKVLGENIKKELGHIRSEINRTSSTQTFTTEQIDAIATRLPADKSELMRFFPKSWCDRYGDVVLDVVHKEFKGHVKDMEAARKTAKEKRRSENDENSGHRENGATTTTTISKATSKPPAPQQQRDQDRSARPRPRTAADPPALPRAGASRRRTRALRDEQRRR